MGDERRTGDATDATPDWFAVMAALTTLHGYAELLHRRIARGQHRRDELAETSTRVLTQADRMEALLKPAFEEWLRTRAGQSERDTAGG